MPDIVVVDGELIKSFNERFDKLQERVDKLQDKLSDIDKDSRERHETLMRQIAEFSQKFVAFRATTEERMRSGCENFKKIDSRLEDLESNSLSAREFIVRHDSESSVKAVNWKNIGIVSGSISGFAALLGLVLRILGVL